MSHKLTLTKKKILDSPSMSADNVSKMKGNLSATTTGKQLKNSGDLALVVTNNVNVSFCLFLFILNFLLYSALFI